MIPLEPALPLKDLLEPLKLRLVHLLDAREELLPHDLPDVTEEELVDLDGLYDSFAERIHAGLELGLVSDVRGRRTLRALPVGIVKREILDLLIEQPSAVKMWAVISVVSRLRVVNDPFRVICSVI